MKKLYEPSTDTIKDTSQDKTKTITETSIQNNKKLNKLNNKFLEIGNDRGIIASYLLSPLYKITKFDISSQFQSVKDSKSKRVMIF